jgi:hypothetical protein
MKPNPTQERACEPCVIVNPEGELTGSYLTDLDPNDTTVQETEIVHGRGGRRYVWDKIPISDTREVEFSHLVSDKCRTNTGSTANYTHSYENMGDISDTAKRCAQTILKGECPVYLFASRKVLGQTDQSRIVSREQVRNFPDRYQAIQL